MRLDVSVAAYFDWVLKHHSQVQGDQVALASHHGADFRLVQETVEEPNHVEITIPDGSIDRMVSDHQEAVANASKGYTAVHEGGSAHGQEVTVPARSLPLKSRNKLIAEHLGDTVLPQHAAAHHVTKVRVVEPYQNADGEPDDKATTKRLEKYLNAQLVEEAGDEEDLAPARHADAAEEPAGEENEPDE